VAALVVQQQAGVQAAWVALAVQQELAALTG
jgi:hypothetical protein